MLEEGIPWEAIEQMDEKDASEWMIIFGEMKQMQMDKINGNRI
jgi:hypothetical protein